MSEPQLVPSAEYRAAQYRGVILVVGRTNLNHGGLHVYLEGADRSIPPRLRFVFEAGIVLNILTTYIRCRRLNSTNAHSSITVSDGAGEHTVDVEQLSTLEELKEEFTWGGRESGDACSSARPSSHGLVSFSRHSVTGVLPRSPELRRPPLPKEIMSRSRTESRSAWRRFMRVTSVSQRLGHRVRLPVTQSRVRSMKPFAMPFKICQLPTITIQTS